MRKAFTLTRLQNNRLAAYIISLLFLAGSILMGISIGSLEIPVSVILRIFWHEGFGGAAGSYDPMYTNIMMNIRLPRVVLAALVGAALSLAGAAFQGLLKNPLADPYTLGVSSGASAGAVMTLFFGLQLPMIGGFTLPVISVAAALATMLTVLSFSRLIHDSMSVSTLILTGIITNSFLGALISLVIALTGDDLLPIVHWLLGSVSMRGWRYVILFLPFFLKGAVLLILNGRELNVMTYGEDKARMLGVSVQRRKIIILIAGSLLTGSAVAVSGTIGFVGLVIPHITRLIWGTDHRHLLPLSALIGAGFLVLADVVSRTLIEPVELPIGIMTALAGAPVFALILLRQHRGGKTHD
ncbi:iron ABC transporter permease [Bacillus sp. HU-1818]|uniref:FecCD family ABC transporter permease n=1 Tax=Bacillus sp. HU-1818 TaxID=2704469 RepID=UPI001F5DCCF7|nr:iron ABC transporter permease [Bacillus sp. HU-1818]MCI3195851.1 iron ABC transporter permease [Bacillus sp. HU-1818]